MRQQQHSASSSQYPGFHQHRRQAEPSSATAGPWGRSRTFYPPPPYLLPPGAASTAMTPPSLIVNGNVSSAPTMEQNHRMPFHDRTVTPHTSNGSVPLQGLYNQRHPRHPYVSYSHPTMPMQQSSHLPHRYFSKAKAPAPPGGLAPSNIGYPITSYQGQQPWVRARSFHQYLPPQAQDPPIMPELSKKRKHAASIKSTLKDYPPWVRIKELQNEMGKFLKPEAFVPDLRAPYYTEMYQHWQNVLRFIHSEPRREGRV